MLGRHLIVELYGCNPALLDDADFLKMQCATAAAAMGATIVSVHAHRFHPVGVSVVVVLSESHLTMHTWPEHATASLDIFVCCPQVDPQQAKTSLANSLQAAHTAEMELDRGNLDASRTPRWLSEGLPT